MVSYHGYIYNHIVPEIGNIELNKIDTECLQLFFNEKATGKRVDGKSGGLSPKTLRNMRMMLHIALKKAYELDLVKKNYVEFVKLPVYHQNEMRVLSLSEQRKLINAINSSDYRY